MFDRCFRCGQTGHTRSQCPQKKQHPAALASPAAHTWKPPPPPVERHAYPDDHPLNYACGFCGAGYHQACVNVGTGKSRPPHFTRIDSVPLLASPGAGPSHRPVPPADPSAPAAAQSPQASPAQP